MNREKGFSYDEWRQLIKEIGTIGGLIGLVLVYGIDNLWGFARRILSVFGLGFANSVRAVYGNALVAASEAIAFASPYARRAANLLARFVNWSLIALVVLILSVIVGVWLDSVYLITIVGIGVGLWFATFAFVVEKSVLVFGAGVDMSESFLRSFGGAIKALFSKDSHSDVRHPSEERVRDKFKELRFLSVATTTFSFLVCLLCLLTRPWSNTSVYELLFVIILAGLNISLLAYWLGVAGKIWKKYYAWAPKAVVATIIMFALGAVLHNYFPTLQEKLRTTAPKQLDKKASEGLDWLLGNASDEYQQKLIKMVTPKMPVQKQVTVIKVPVLVPAPTPTPAPVSQPKVQWPIAKKKPAQKSPARKDLEQEAALAAYLKMKEMDKEDKTSDSSSK